MRAGGCAVQQALAAEAAAVVRQAVALARRRGHAQVTPLHVASSMLSAAGLLRAACLRSHSHPLQCKALELCFNVALNRLPTAAGPFHGHIAGAQHRAPVLSNALVAAFKRAQAYQRRGAVEGQPTPAPVVAAKVDLEQLIVSILDDPSVSRVMREAGFSSSQVKANVEKAVSASTVDDANATCSPNSSHGCRAAVDSRAKTDNDAMRVLDCMASGTMRCMVVVGKGAEAAVKAVMDRVSKAELHHRHERLKSIHFVPLSVASFETMAREEVEAKASDLRTLVREGRAAGKGVVLILEDLAFAAEAWSAVSEKRRGEQQHYCPVEHAVMEVSSLVSDSGGGGRSHVDRFWLLGFGSHPVFMRCRAGQPSLEAVWGMHPVVVPDGGSALSIISCSSEAQANSQARSGTGWPAFANGAAAAGGEREFAYCAAAAEVAPMSTIPSWLHRYQDPNHTNLQLQDLWNPMRYGSAPRHTSDQLTLSFSPTSPATSLLPEFTHCHNTTNLMRSSKQPWQLESRQRWPSNQVHGSTTVTMVDGHDHPSGANPNSESVDGGMVVDHQPKFRELTAENLKIMCNTLEDRIPRHKAVAPGIASTVLRCRSGMARRFGRREKPSSATWLLFQGRDNDAKKAMAHELAKLVFGSYTEFVSISTAAVDAAAPIHSGTNSDELITLKRRRSPDQHGYAERLYEVMRQNPRQVVMIDNIEQLDHYSGINIKKSIVNGRLRCRNGDEVRIEDAIVVLSSEAFDSESRASFSPRVKRRAVNNNDDQEEKDDPDVAKGPGFSLDLNANADDEEAEEHDMLLDDVEISDVVDGVFHFGLVGDLLVH